MTRVKLPRDVAESIEQLRSEGFENRYIIECALNTKEPCVLTMFASEVSFDDLMAALTYGYDVKGTPADEIYTYYRHHQNNVWDYGDDSRDPDYHRSQGALDAVEYVLDELNVKIIGINEKEER
jgi:hypothetical protein